MSLKATEFETGNLHERYSGETSRRRVAASGAAWGGTSAATGGASAALAAHRVAGRPVGQKLLEGAAIQHPIAKPAIDRFATRSLKVAKKPKTVLAATLGLGATGAATGAVARFRRNEEAGISQGLGRIKAGSQYSSDQKRIGKSLMGNVGMAATLAQDPAMRRAAFWAGKHKGKLMATSAVGSGGVLAVTGAQRGKARVKTMDETRAALKVAKGERYIPTPEQLAAQKAKREAQAAGAQAAKDQAANTRVGAKWKGKPLSQTWRAHVARGQVRNAITSGALAAGTGTLIMVNNKQAKINKSDRTRRNVNTAAGAIGGAAAVDTLNTVGGQSAKALLKERRNRRGTSPNEDLIWSEHKRKSLGIKPGQQIPGDSSIPQSAKAKTFRTYPKQLPDYKGQRLLAVKNTKAWTVGSLATGTVAGGLIARNRTKVNKGVEDLSNLPRAARRAAAKGRTIKTPEEIAVLRAEAAARNVGRQQAPQAPKIKAEKAPKPQPKRERSSFLGGGQIRDLAIGIPVGAGALVYSGRKPVEKRDSKREAHRGRWGQAVGGAALLDSADTLAGASLKRIGVIQRDRAKRRNSPEKNTEIGNKVRAHGVKHGFVNSEGKGRTPRPDDAHKAKNAYYRKYPLDVPGGRTQRLIALRDKKTPLVLATGALAGGLYANRRQDVNKGISHLAVAGLTGSGLTGYRIGQKKDDRDRQATAAAVGGWAGQGAYQAPAYAARKYVRGFKSSKVPKIETPGMKANAANFPDKAERNARTAYIKQAKEHKDRYERLADRKRNTPPNWHGAKMERILGRTHGGKTGTAIGTAVTGVGGLTALAISEKRANAKTKARTKINKRVYGYHDHKISPLRATEAALGVTLMGWGGSRLGIVGRTLRAGAKTPGRSGMAFGRAERARNGIETVTGRGAQMLSENLGVGTRIRPAEATLAGGLLVHNSIPIRREKFTPVQQGGF